MRCAKACGSLAGGYDLSMKKMTAQTQDGPMVVHVTLPEGDPSQKRPAMIVLQEAFGVNSHIRHVCQIFADHGYVALAPELFHRSGAGIEIAYTEFMEKGRPLMADLSNERLLDDVKATLNLAKTLPQVDPQKVGAIGYCMGGFAAMLGATHLPLAAGISFYGGGMTKVRPGIGLRPILSDLAKIKCPVLLGWGELDHGIPPEEIDHISQELKQNGVNAMVITYPNAHHGFICDERSAFNPQMAEKAWKDTFKWLHDCGRMAL
ncbi:MAG: dienelactone hydrolase family protein [Bdellovibrio sp.]|nr:dienelactone hydrolase family protein [Bdellovibrio sp.]